MTACPQLHDLLLPLDPSAAAHVQACAGCADRAAELASTQARVGAALGSSGWPGAPAPEVDVEAALQTILAAAARARTARVLRLVALVRAGAAGAVATLALGLLGPALLRARLATPPHGPPAAPGLVAALPATSGGGTLVLWTP